MYIRFLAPHRVASELLEHTPTNVYLLQNSSEIFMLETASIKKL